MIASGNNMPTVCFFDSFPVFRSHILLCWTCKGHGAVYGSNKRITLFACYLETTWDSCCSRQWFCTNCHAKPCWNDSTFIKSISSVLWKFLNFFHNFHKMVLENGPKYWIYKYYWWWNKYTTHLIKWT